MAQSGEHGLIAAEEQEIAERGFAFAARYTRLPVCERDGGLDAPWGLIHVHDLLTAVLGDRPSSLRRLMRPLPRRR